jgi:hypothetical protein
VNSVSNVQKEEAPVHSSDGSLDLKIWTWEGNYPKRLDLLNPFNGKSFPMQLKSAYRICASKEMRAKENQSRFSRLTTTSMPAEADHLRAFTVRMEDPRPEILKNARAAFSVDGEILIKGTAQFPRTCALRDLLQETVFEKSKERQHAFFEARDKGAWVGYMLTNSSVIEFNLYDLPEKFEPFKISVDFELIRYGT